MIRGVVSAAQISSGLAVITFDTCAVGSLIGTSSVATEGSHAFGGPGGRRPAGRRPASKLGRSRFRWTPAPASASVVVSGEPVPHRQAGVPVDSWGTRFPGRTDARSKGGAVNVDRGGRAA